MADLIDRAALLDEIQHDIENSGCVNHEREIIDCVRYAPTVEAEPVVRARWVEEYSDYFIGSMPYHDDWLVCSACGRKETELNERDETKETLKYCHCGARMDADAPERARKDGRDEQIHE